MRRHSRLDRYRRKQRKPVAFDLLPVPVADLPEWNKRIVRMLAR